MKSEKKLSFVFNPEKNGGEQLIIAVEFHENGGSFYTT